MCVKDTLQRFGFVSKLLHWTIGIIMIVQFYVIFYYEEIPKDSPLKLEYILLHKSLGITLLVLGVFFVIWRLVNQRPLLPDNLTKREVMLAKATHFLLFTLMVLIPFTGYALSTSAGRASAWFGYVDLPLLWPASKSAAGLFKEIHEYLAYTLLGLLALHLLATIKHHFLLKDDVLKRMLPWGK